MLKQTLKSSSLDLIHFAVVTENITSDSSYLSKLIMNGITAADEGTFVCMAENLINTVAAKFINVTIKVAGMFQNALQIFLSITNSL